MFTIYSIFQTLRAKFLVKSTAENLKSNRQYRCIFVPRHQTPPILIVQCQASCILNVGTGDDARIAPIAAASTAAVLRAQYRYRCIGPFLILIWILIWIQPC